MLTNKYNLSSGLIDILKEEDRPLKPKNRYSVTQLMGSPRESVLSETEEPIEDVSDSFLAFLGTCVHYYFEKHTDGQNELHLETQVDDYVVSGIIDHLENGVITDYKTKKCSDVNYDDAKKQIKIYAWLLRKNNIIANQGRIVVIRRDWSKLRNQNQSPIEEIFFSINSSDIEEAEEYVRERLKIFDEARRVLPECTPKEKWSTDSTWAVYAKKGDYKAKKVFKSLEEAEDFSQGKMFIEYRPGVDIKCESFCPYSRVCKRILSKKKNAVI